MIPGNQLASLLATFAVCAAIWSLAAVSVAALLVAFLVVLLANLQPPTR